MLFVREDAVEAAWAIVDPSSRIPPLCTETNLALTSPCQR